MFDTGDCIWYLINRQYSYFYFNWMLVLPYHMNVGAKKPIATNTIWFLFLKLKLLLRLSVWGIFRKHGVYVFLWKRGDVPQQSSAGHHGPKLLWSAIKTENILFPLYSFICWMSIASKQGGEGFYVFDTLSTWLRDWVNSTKRMKRVSCRFDTLFTQLANPVARSSN